MAPVGILALQGDFEAHTAALTRAGHAAREVRCARDLEGVAGLVLPGGESSVMVMLLADLGLDRAIVAWAAQGLPLLATCAGLVLLAREVRDPAQPSLGLLDVAVSRNGWGRQAASFEATDDEGTRRMVFIRAPRIRAVGARATVLARYRGEPVLVRQGAVFAACYHPELETTDALHSEVFAAA